MSESKLGIRIYNPSFTGQLKKLKQASNVFFQTPVSIDLPITLMDAHDPSYKRTDDNIKVIIVDVNQKSDDHIVVIHARVTEGSKNIKKVPVESEGNVDAEEEILHNDDFLTIVADVANGDAVITLCSDGKDREVDLDTMVDVLPRLDIPDGLPESKGAPIAWDDFDPDQENN